MNKIGTSGNPISDNKEITTGQQLRNRLHGRESSKQHIVGKPLKICKVLIHVTQNKNIIIHFNLITKGLNESRSTIPTVSNTKTWKNTKDRDEDARNW